VAVGFVVFASFLVFFLIGSRVVPDFPAVSILALSVVEMAFAHDVESGLRFAGMFALNLSLVYALHFLFWPTRPRIRMKTQIEIITKNLLNYETAIKNDYQNPEHGMLATQELSDQVRKSIGDFRRLWQLFGLNRKENNITELRYLEIYTGLEKVYEYLVLTWQFRVSVWKSKIFENKITRNQELNDIISYLIRRHNPSLIKPSEKKLLEKQKQIQKTIDDILDQIKNEYSKETHVEWIAVINALKSLEALLLELGNQDEIREVEISEFSAIGKIKSFFKNTKEAFKNLKPSHPAFRLGLRSMLIIGGTMAWSVFLEPDYGYWLVLFAVLLIRPNLGISIKVGKERIIGTIAGSLLAMGFVWALPAGSIMYIAILLLSAFLMIWFININRMIPMVTFMTMMIIGIFYILYPDDANLVWLRILYTAAIVLMVIVASFLIWPDKARNRFATALADALILEKNFFSKTINAIYYPAKNLITIAEKQEIRNQIQKLNDTIEATRNEVLQERVIAHGLNIRSYIMRMLNTLQTIDSITKGCDFDNKHELLITELQKFDSAIKQAFDALISALQNKTDVQDFPELREAFERLRTTFREIKYGQGPSTENIAQFWKNSALIWVLKPLIHELEGVRDEINLKMEEI
jgi:uncharacterized membrane protein YgaE (UPF0421/DUF939 family)